MVRNWHTPNSIFGSKFTTQMSFAFNTAGVSSVRRSFLLAGLLIILAANDYAQTPSNRSALTGVVQDQTGPPSSARRSS
jgi:hypothetical protein